MSGDQEFAGFIAQTATNLHGGGIGEALTALVGEENTAAALAAVEALGAAAMEKTRLLYAGAKPGTLLRNDLLETTAQRYVNDRGIPEWCLRNDKGVVSYTRDPILTPAEDWTRVWAPPGDDG